MGPLIVQWLRLQMGLWKGSLELTAGSICAVYFESDLSPFYEFLILTSSCTRFYSQQKTIDKWT